MSNALIRPLAPESSTGPPPLFNIRAKRLRSDANHITVLSRSPQLGSVIDMTNSLIRFSRGKK